MSAIGTHTLVVTVKRPEFMDDVAVRIQQAPLRIYDAVLSRYRNLPAEICRNDVSFEVKFQASAREATSVFGTFQDSLSGGRSEVTVSYRGPSAVKQAA